MENNENKPLDNTNKKPKGKLIATILVELLGTIGIVLFLVLMQTNAACRKQYTNSTTKLDEVLSVMVRNASEKESEIESYDEDNQAKASTISYIINTDKEVQDNLKNEDTAYDYANNLIKELADEDNFNLDTISFFDITTGKQISYSQDPDNQNLTFNIDAIKSYVLDGTGSDLSIKDVFTPFNYDHSATSDYVVSVPTDEQLSSNKIIRYYGCKITDTLMLLIGQDPTTLYNKVNKMVSLNYLLSDITVGSNGYVFAINKDKSFAYYPDSTLIGKDSLSYGINDQNSTDGYNGWITINGTKLYCVAMSLSTERIESKFDELYKEKFAEYVSSNSMTQAEADAVKDYIITAVSNDFAGLDIFVAGVTQAEINQSSIVTCSIGAILFILVSALQITYSYIVKDDASKRHQQKSIKVTKNFYLNTTIFKKIVPINLVGIIVITLATVFSQSIYALSKQITSNKNYLSEINQTLVINDTQAQEIVASLESQYLAKCDAVNYVVESNSSIKGLFLDSNNNHVVIHRDQITNEQRNMCKSYLSTLASDMGVIDIYLINTDGETLAASSVYQDFDLSTDPTAQSYIFWNILKGYSPYIIQEAITDDVGNSSKYIGQPIYKSYVGADGKTYNDIVGMVQISVDANAYVESLAVTDISHVLDNIIVGTQGFAFSIDKTDSTISYYPTVSNDYTMIGKTSASLGLPEAALKDDYFNEVKLNGTNYWISSMEYNNDYVYVAVPTSEVMEQVTGISIATGIASLILLSIFSFIMVFSKHDETEFVEATDDEKGSVITVTMPNGKKKTVTKAVARWDNTRLSWYLKTPGQKLATLVTFYIEILGIILAIMLLGANTFFGSNSIFAYIQSGDWEKGFNIFSMTYVVSYAIIILVASIIIRWLLTFCLKNTNSRVETVGRLFSNLIKYAAYIWVIFMFLSTIGVDTTTLLTSAGILSIVIGLGAQSLIQDVLAGLFIVFEGEFRVGDIVTVGDWRGQVLEIGLRTTKIEDASSNIKIFNNNNISGVVNMTKEYSYAVCDVGIEYGESIERVEAVLKEEFPSLKKKMPLIKDGPFYLGVVELGSGSIIIRIIAQCDESDRLQVDRELKREIKIIFDKHHINIPYPQIVVNKPTNYKEVSKKEKSDAKKFVDEQKSAMSNINPGDTDKD